MESDSRAIRWITFVAVIAGLYAAMTTGMAFAVNRERSANDIQKTPVELRQETRELTAKALLLQVFAAAVMLCRRVMRDELRKRKTPPTLGSDLFDVATNVGIAAMMTLLVYALAK